MPSNSPFTDRVKRPLFISRTTGLTRTVPCSDFWILLDNRQADTISNFVCQESGTFEQRNPIRETVRTVPPDINWTTNRSGAISRASSPVKQRSNRMLNSVSQILLERENERGLLSITFCRTVVNKRRGRYFKERRLPLSFPRALSPCLTRHNVCVKSDDCGKNLLFSRLFPGAAYKSLTTNGALNEKYIRLRMQNEVKSR